MICRGSEKAAQLGKLSPAKFLMMAACCLRKIASQVKLGRPSRFDGRETLEKWAVDEEKVLI